MLLEQKVGKSLNILIFLKLLHNPKHDLGLVLFGTKETANTLNDQMGNDEYSNVVTDKALGPIDL